MSKSKNEIVVTPEVVSDNKKCKSSIQTVCNTVVVVQPFLSTIAREVIASKERIAALNEEIVLVEKQNNYNIQRMKIAFENIRSTIESTNEQIKELLDQMKAFDVKNMDEAQTRTYNGLMIMIVQMREQMFSLYNRIL